MDRAALARLDEEHYSNGTDTLDGRAFAYTDDGYNLGGLQQWEIAALQAHFPASGRVVVTGAGAGREVAALLDRNFEAVGYEPNLALVQAGTDLLRRRGYGSALRLCERDTFPADAGSCDAVIVGWSSYMLIPGRARRVEFLRGARRTLADGAPLLCSFFARPPAARYFDVVLRTANVIRRLRRADRAELGDTVRQHYRHYFTRAEIRSELADAGFEMVAFATEPYGHAVAIASGERQPRTPSLSSVGRSGAVAEPGTPAPAAKAAPTVLELTAITKRWPRLEQIVLDEVDLSLIRGTATLMGGANGTGKTTLLRIAAGLIGADAGRVRLEDLDPIADRRAFHSRIALLAAGSGGVYARLTVDWHLEWWGRLAFLSGPRRREAAANARMRFDLDAIRHRRLDRLSMGQRQRVRLAGTFLHDPDVILLDEPRNSLDGAGVERLVSAVADATARGAAVLWAAPTGEPTPFDFDRHLALNRGRLVSA
jgi:ABC-type multidrug transport system ATPase subunit